MHRSLVFLTVLGLLSGGVSSARPPGGAEDQKVTLIERLDPVRFSLAEAKTERHLITARDGITSLAVDVIRPNTKEKVPTIYLQSPYYNTVGRGYLHETKTPWGTGGQPAQPQTPFPEWYDEYFVPRGYAVVMSDMRGTRNSSGCQVYGGREEVTDAVDVIEWIAEQDWSNGKVGMTGGSYDGTVAIGAASEAPKALKAIIPIRAIDRWYDYHFFNGLQSSQHLLTPWSFTSLTTLQDQQNSFPDDALFPLHVIERKACAVSLGAAVSAQYSVPYQDSTSEFWASRDWVRDAKDFKAATFIIHGLDDTNVKTTNAAWLWDSLPKGLPKKLWFARMGHADPKQPDPSEALPFPFDDRFVEATHRWFAHFLKGIETGVVDEPAVSIQDRFGLWHDQRAWPIATDVTYSFKGNTLLERPAKGNLSYEEGSTHALTTKPLKRDLRISGEAYVQLTYSLSQAGDTTFAYRLEDVGSGGATEIASGYARGAYRDEIRKRGLSYPTLPAPHQPGVFYEISFPFLPQDYVIPAGHRLRLVLDSSDSRVLGDVAGETVTLDLTGSRLVIPVADPH